MTPAKIFKQIKLIYFIVVIMLALFAGLTFFYVTAGGQAYPMDVNAENNLKSLMIILALAGIPASYLFLKRKIKHIDSSLNPTQKLQQFRTGYFIKIVTLEGLSLLSLLVYLMTANLNQFLIFGLIYGYLLINYPIKNTILDELEIDPKNL